MHPQSARVIYWSSLQPYKIQQPKFSIKAKYTSKMILLLDKHWIDKGLPFSASSFNAKIR